MVQHYGECALEAISHFEKAERGGVRIHTFSKLGAIVDPTFMEYILVVMKLRNPRVNLKKCSPPARSRSGDRPGVVKKKRAPREEDEDIEDHADPKGSPGAESGKSKGAQATSKGKGKEWAVPKGPRRSGQPAKAGRKEPVSDLGRRLAGAGLRPPAKH